MSFKPVDYKQQDSRWGGLPYAVDGEKSTIKSAGCGITCMAMVIASLASPYVTPITTASWSRMKGYKVKNSGTAYTYFVPQGKEYGIKVTRINTSNIYNQPNSPYHEKIKQELINGNWVIACMGKGLWTSSGHYVLAWKYDNGDIYINDCASTKAERNKNKFDTFKSQVKYYWVIEVNRDSIVTEGDYKEKDFVRECQYCLGAGLDGVAGNQTLSKTITVSAKKNRTHFVVVSLQNKMKFLKLYNGAIDKVVGVGMTKAINDYQTTILKYLKGDGEITAKGNMWKSLLGMKK